MRTKPLLCLALALSAAPMAARAQGQPMTTQLQPVAPATLADRVTAAHGALREAMIANDPDAQARLYRADARSMFDYQPALYGRAQIAAYLREMRGRRRVTGYVPATGEVFDLGSTIVEIGTFTITWSTAGGETQTERGKYTHVWGMESDGSLKLKADCRGYFRPLADPAGWYVALDDTPPPQRAFTPEEQRLAEVLKARNEGMARAVRTRDVEAKIADYTDDAIYMPFADTNKVGIAAIRAHLVPYTAAGAGVTFDLVRVWNEGFEDLGAYVIEYPKFRVEWSAGQSSGVSKGGGIRLWKRMADGTLKLYRQIGTHDYVE